MSVEELDGIVLAMGINHAWFILEQYETQQGAQPELRAFLEGLEYDEEY